ncbi:MAG: MASE1 domain-containing protein, partial [Ignavibacteriae bacterium]|nr:MASE1 domain-containing protein [Ignavibacteriota bacterium]
MNFGIKSLFNFSSSKIINSIIQIIFVFLLYFGADFIGSKVAIDKIYTLPIWVPAGIILAASIIVGYKILPSVLIGILISIIAILTYDFNSFSLWDFSFTSIGIAIGETLEIFIGTFLIKKIIKENDFFNHPSYFTRFILIAVLISIIGASIGSTVLALVYSGTAGIYSTVWLTWLISHLTAYVVITPLILSLRAKSFLQWTNKTIIEAIAFIIILIILSQIIFGEEIPKAVIFSSPYLVIPLLLWAVIKFSHREVAIALVVLAGFAIWYTVRGSGPFYNGNLERSILSLQGYLLIISVSTLLLYSAISELRATEKELRSYKENLELKVAERSEEIKQNNI